MSDVHTCSYQCERPECIRAQRDALVRRVEKLGRLESVSTDIRVFVREDAWAIYRDDELVCDMASAPKYAWAMAEILCQMLDLDCIRCEWVPPDAEFTFSLSLLLSQCEALDD